MEGIDYILDTHSIEYIRINSQVQHYLNNDDEMVLCHIIQSCDTMLHCNMLQCYLIDLQTNLLDSNSMHNLLPELYF